MRHLTGILIFLLLLPLAADAQNRSGEGDVRELYDQNCAGCHGDDLGGGSGSSLVDDEWIDGDSDEAIAAAIRSSSVATITVADLRAYHERLLDPRRIWLAVVTSLPAEQVSSLAMAIFLNSMSFDEAATLTQAMAESGTVLAKAPAMLTFQSSPSFSATTARFLSRSMLPSLEAAIRGSVGSTSRRSSSGVLAIRAWVLRFDSV